MIHYRKLNFWVEFSLKEKLKISQVDMMQNVLAVFAKHELLFPIHVRGYYVKEDVIIKYPSMEDFLYNNKKINPNNYTSVLVDITGNTLIHEEDADIWVDNAMAIDFRFYEEYRFEFYMSSQVDSWRPIGFYDTWQIKSGLKNGDRFEQCCRDLVMLLGDVKIEPNYISREGGIQWGFRQYNHPLSIEFAIEYEGQPKEVEGFDLAEYTRTCKLLNEGIVPDNLKCPIDFALKQDRNTEGVSPKSSLT